MKNVCVIPARGGSKRIKNKNIKLFAGKPIIAYSIEAALDSGLFEDVIVSTDSEEIRGVARKFGASVPFLRSNRNADDHATLNDVVLEVRDKLLSSGKEYDNLCLILATAPLIQVDTIRQGYEKLYDGDFECVTPVVKFSYPIQRAYLLDKEGKLVFERPEFAKTRSQDIDERYHDAAQFYWMRFAGELMLGTNGCIELSSILVQDIDDELDWQMAELKYRFLTKETS